MQAHPGPVRIAQGVMLEITHSTMIGRGKLMGQHSRGGHLSQYLCREGLATMPVSDRMMLVALLGCIAWLRCLVALLGCVAWLCCLVHDQIMQVMLVAFVTKYPGASMSSISKPCKHVIPAASFCTDAAQEEPVA